MIATYVPPVLTRIEPIDASRGYREAVTKLTGIVPSPEGVAVLHAHGALETGHFKSCWCGNAGNIKAGPKYSGKYTAIKLNEQLKRGGVLKYIWFDPSGELTSKDGTIVPGTESAVPPGHAQCRMRAYDSVALGIEDKIDFLMEPHWRSALDIALAGQAAAYAIKLHDLGYYTADPGPYSRAVVSLFVKYLPVSKDAALEPKPLPMEQEEELERDMESVFRFDLSTLDLRPDRDEFWLEQQAARDAAIKDSNE
jgi:hypothetical protein